MHSRRSQPPAHSASPADARSVPPRSSDVSRAIAARLGASAAAPASPRELPLRSSDVSCVILPRLGASDAAPAAPIRLSARTAAPRLAHCKTHHPLQPSAQPAQPTAGNIIHAQPAVASTRSQRKPSRCTQRTAEVQSRQLRHPSETRCQRRCPSWSDPIVCTHHRPSARSSQAPPPATA